ncbi:MAG: FAD-binding oxidoreductase [bacterium]|nr:FAD-binding oxidoreductase [bacterium]
MEYGIITDEILAALADIVGVAHLWTTEEKREACSRDETTTLRASERYLPDAVVAPASAREVSEILKLACRHRIPVTPRGGGTGLSGGALPIYGGIVVSDERLNHIIEIDAENLVAVTEPGVITSEINAAAAEKGLAYTGYPMSVLSCHIGGNIAENAGGGNAVKYGVTMRYVLGLEVVLPTGEILALGGKLMKDVSGYSLKELFVGSEGTLGYVTKVILRLQPLMQNRAALLALFPDTGTAIRAVPKMMAHGGLVPSSIEYIDAYCYRKACGFLNEELPMEGVEAVLLVEVDGSNQESLDMDIERAGEILSAEGAAEIYVADTRTTRERIWSVRRNIDEALRVTDPVQVDEDIVVPIAAIPAAARGLREIEEKYGVPIANFGHAGDGNLHPTILKPAEMTLEEWERVETEIEWEIFRLTDSLGGVISGEHGIGSKRKGYFAALCPPDNLALMKRIKLALDPHNIMNPGKIFD